MNNPEGGNRSNMPNMKVVKGLLAILLGIILIVSASRIVLHIVLFATGIMLTYYGLVILNMKQATDYIDHVIGKIRQFLGR